MHQHLTRVKQSERSVMLKFRVASSDVTFTDEQARYFILRESFRDVARNEFSNARRDFKNAIEDIGADGCETLIELINKYARKAASFALAFLTREQCYEVSIDSFIGLLDAKSFFKDEFKKLKSLVTQGVTDVAEVSERKAQQLDESEGFFGNTIAIIGKKVAENRAVKNAESKVIDYLNDENTLDNLAGDVANMVFYAHEVTKDILNKWKGCEFCEELPDGATDSAQNLLDQIKAGMVPDEQQQTIYVRAINLDPFNAEAYKHILCRFGDVSGDLAKMAKLFGIGGYERLQRAILYVEVEKLSLNTSDDLRLAWTKASEIADRIGTNKDVVSPVLDRRQWEIDTNSRIFDGRVFDSVLKKDKQVKFASYIDEMSIRVSSHMQEDAYSDAKKQADKLGADFESSKWRIDRRIAVLQNEFNTSLEEFYKTIKINSENDAIGAREIVRHKAEELGCEGFENYFPLEKIINQYDKNARSVAGHEFTTRMEAAKQRAALELMTASEFLRSKEKCLELIERLTDVSSKERIDVSWLMKDVKQALCRHEENARVEYGYLYRSEEEKNCAASDDRLFFLALWSAIANFSQANKWLVLRDSFSDAAKGTLRSIFAMDPSEVYAFVDTAAFIVQGQTGLAIGRKGIVIVDGSAVAAKVCDSKIIQKLSFGKLSGFLEKHRPKRYELSWNIFFSSSCALQNEDGRIVFGAYGNLKCGSEKSTKLMALFGMMKNWAESRKNKNIVPPDTFPDAELIQTELHLTAWPEEIEDKIEPPANAADDFPKPVKISDEPANYLYNTWTRESLRVSISDKPLKGVTVLPDIDEEKLSKYRKNVGEKFDVNVSEVVCCVEGSWLGGRNKAVFLCDDRLVGIDGKEMITVKLSRVVDVTQHDNGFVVTTIDVNMSVHRRFGRNEFGNVRIEFPLSGEGFIVSVLQHFLSGPEKPKQPTARLEHKQEIEGRRHSKRIARKGKKDEHK